MKIRNINFYYKYEKYSFGEEYKIAMKSFSENLLFGVDFKL